MQNRLIHTLGKLAATMMVCAGLASCTSSAATLGSVNAFSATDPAPGPYGNLETGILSGQIGEGLTSGMRKRALEAEYLALERGQTGASIKWETTAGASGEIVPQQPYQVGDRDCRRYTHRVVLAGSERSATGTACRTSDGVWTPLT